MSIKFVKHSNIDRQKWDSCIRQSFNGLIYAYSWYLDIACEYWDALIDADYERVMPLPNKAAIIGRCVYQPIFAPQLGIFAVEKLSPQVVRSFISAIPAKFRSLTIVPNKFNRMELCKNVQESMALQFQTDLIEDYSRASQKFTQKGAEMLSRAGSFKLKVSTDMPLSAFIDFYSQWSGNTDYITKLRLQSIANSLIKLKVAEIRSIADENGDVLSAGIFLGYVNNACLLNIVNTAKAFINGAPQLLISSYIKDNSKKNICMEFPQASTPAEIEIYESLGFEKTELQGVRRSPWYEFADKWA
jgi:hypothetical protein